MRQLSLFENLKDEAEADRNRVADRQRFIEHLKRCATEIATWPEWKRNLLGWKYEN